MKSRVIGVTAYRLYQRESQMPRVTVCKSQREISRFTDWVCGRMKDNDMTQADLARTLGISQQAVSQKMRNKSWSLSDVTDICEAFGSDYTISMN